MCCSSTSGLIVSYWHQQSAASICQPQQSKGMQRATEWSEKQKLEEVESMEGKERGKQSETKRHMHAVIVKLLHFGARRKLQHLANVYKLVEKHALLPFIHLVSSSAPSILTTPILCLASVRLTSCVLMNADQRKETHL